MLYINFHGAVTLTGRFPGSGGLVLLFCAKKRNWKFSWQYSFHVSAPRTGALFTIEAKEGVFSSPAQALVNVKGKLRKECFPVVVYEVPCTNCHRVHIGASRNFERRLKQYCNDVQNEKVFSNTVTEHAHASNHEIDWGTTEKEPTRRLYLESFTIETRKSMLNRMNSNLPAAYTKCLGHVS